MSVKYGADVKKRADTFKIFEEKGIYQSEKELQNIADIIGVSLTTMHRWKKSFIDTHPDFKNPATTEDNFKQLMQATLECALEGKNPQFARAYKEMVEFQKKQGDVENRELSADEINIIAVRVKETLRGEVRETGGSCPICGVVSELRQEPCDDTGCQHGDGGEMAAMGLPA